MNKILPIFFMILLAAAGVYAEEEGPPATGEKQVHSPIVDRVHQGFETRLDRYAAYFDNFFVADRADEEAADSQIRLIGSFQYHEGGHQEFSQRIRARIALPHLSRRINILFDTDSDEIGSLADQTAATQTTLGSKDPSNLAVQLIQKSTADIGISHRLGLKIKEGQLDPMLRSQARFTWLISKRDLIRFTQAIFWGNFDGFGEESRLDFEHLMHHNDRYLSSLMRITLSGLVSEESDGYEWSLPIEILNSLPNQRAYAYGASISGVTKSETGITNSAIFFRYRQSIWREWFYVDLIPQLEWPKSKGRNTTALMTVSLEILF